MLRCMRQAISKASREVFRCYARVYRMRLCCQVRRTFGFLCRAFLCMLSHCPATFFLLFVPIADCEVIACCVKVWLHSVTRLLCSSMQVGRCMRPHGQESVNAAANASDR